jgi:hypothetical protein
MAVSPRLWETDRPFPTVPIYPWIPELPQIPCLALSGLFALSLVVCGLVREPKKWILVPPMLGLSLVVFDINRLQPWFLQYMPMLVALSLARPNGRWAGCAVAIIGVYIWSGLQKFNATFAVQVFPWLLHPFTDVFNRFWFMAPIYETGVGLLLLFPRTRKWGVYGAVAMHAFLLFALGPWGQNYDSIVWPWNVGVAAAVVTLFWRREGAVLPMAWAEPYGKVLLLFLGAMPALNFVDRWDGFLSASFYSGKLRDGWIYLTARGVSHLPPEYREGNEGLVKESSNRFRLDIQRWSMSRLNAPPYAEPRFYAAEARKLISRGVPREEMTLVVRDVPALTKDVNSVSTFPIEP